MTYEPTFDFETYSEAGHVWEPPSDRKPLGRWTSFANAPQGKKGLQIVGAAVYTEHPTAEILCLRYDIHGSGEPTLWFPGMPPPADLFDYLARGGIIEAHNAMFERLTWENIAVPKYGWPPLNPYQLRCSMATARVNNLPGSLEKLGDVLDVETKKDKDGKRLLTKFSVPRTPTKSDPRLRIRPADDPEDAARLYDYCRDDVRAEQSAAAHRWMRTMSPAELLFWQIDQEINHRGLGIDRAAVRDCLAIIDQAIEQYSAECVQITGGIQPSQLQEIRGWLAGQGVRMPDMQSDTIEMKLGDPNLPPLARRVLEIRSLTGSASVKKLYAMEYQANRRDRLQNLIVHHGARTGRPTGEGPQPLNLPKAGPKLVTCGACEKPHRVNVDACPWCAVPCPPIDRKGRWHPESMVEPVLEIIATRQLALVEWFFGDAMLAVQGCVRSMFVADEGNDLIASDYSAIEAVVLAMLAGEQWRIDAFRNNEPIYLVGASKITGTPVDEYLRYNDEHGEHHPDRQNIGKVSELACGFGGWIGSYKAFGSTEPDDVIKRQIVAWRNASPAIVEFWGGQWRGPPWRREHAELFGMEGAFIQAVQQPGEAIRPACCPTIAFTYDGTDDLLLITLPSGRQLTYHSPRLERSQRNADELAISYMTWNSNPKYGPMGWVRMDTYGGRITENVVQAVAHDILRHAIINLRTAGYPTVLHVYDEIVAEIPKGTGSLEEFERIMATMPDWCADWPVRAAGGWRGKRYRKG